MASDVIDWNSLKREAFQTYGCYYNPESGKAISKAKLRKLQREQRQGEELFGVVQSVHSRDRQLFTRSREEIETKIIAALFPNLWLWVAKVLISIFQKWLISWIIDQVSKQRTDE